MRCWVMMVAVVVALGAGRAGAQWELQDPHVKADLRGIDYVGNGVAWASGSGGTVLRTEDMGFVWQLCTTPPGAEKLDFRGVQAFDNNTAIVMSSGPGDQSRLYKTTDGCQTWKLVFTNPDKDGFWDAISAALSKDQNSVNALIVGDPVGGSFTLFQIRFPTHGSDFQLVPLNNGLCKEAATMQLPLPLLPCLQSFFDKQARAETPMLEGGTARAERDRRVLIENYKNPQPREGEAIFAASNSSLNSDSRFWFSPNIAIVTGGAKGARFLHFRGWPCAGLGCTSWRVSDIPLANGDSAGAFSLAVTGRNSWRGVVVGGDYKKPDERTRTGAFTTNEGKSWNASRVMPGGYRSAVAYDEKLKAWITVGPNGTDVSTDDGRNWRPLKPGPGDAPDADQHWNALSLPFVVGPKGRIGLLRSDALNPK